jgi:hypothetical protein
VALLRNGSDFNIALLGGVTYLTLIGLILVTGIAGLLEQSRRGSRP